MQLLNPIIVDDHYFSFFSKTHLIIMHVGLKYKIKHNLILNTYTYIE